MSYQLVTCPESAHLELIEYADTPCGLLILECSRFEVSGDVDCPRTCAARFDRRQRTLERILAVGDVTSFDVLGRLAARRP